MTYETQQIDPPDDCEDGHDYRLKRQSECGINLYVCDTCGHEILD
jgi:hypothetical protein